MARGWQPEEIEAVARQVRGDDQVDKKESKERSAAPGSMALFRTTLAEIVKADDPTERAILFDDGTGHSLDTLRLKRLREQCKRRSASLWTCWEWMPA